MEEGIDVPECDAVFDFDNATTSRQQQQRAGRARAKLASYAYLVGAGSDEEKQYNNLRGWNAMAKRLLTERDSTTGEVRRRPSPPTPCAAAAWAEIKDRVVTTYTEDGQECARYPCERCFKVLQDVYVLHVPLKHGDDAHEFDLTGDGEHFTAKEKGAHNFRMERSRRAGASVFSCQLRLPAIKLCCADVGRDLPNELPATEFISSKDEARFLAAQEGVQYLVSIGALDQHLHVVGRHEALRQLREAVGATRRRSTRANKYALHVKAPFARELPTLLRHAPDSDEHGHSIVWCHPMVIDGVPVDVGLLFRDRCPVRELLVHRRHPCLLQPLHGPRLQPCLSGLGKRALALPHTALALPPLAHCMAWNRLHDPCALSRGRWARRTISDNV